MDFEWDRCLNHSVQSTPFWVRLTMLHFNHFLKWCKLCSLIYNVICQCTCTLNGLEGVPHPVAEYMLSTMLVLDGSQAVLSCFFNDSTVQFSIAIFQQFLCSAFVWMCQSSGLISSPISWHKHTMWKPSSWVLLFFICWSRRCDNLF